MKNELFFSFLESIRDCDAPLVDTILEAFTEQFYHGTPDYRTWNKASKGIHIGTKLAATQALESRIGVPAEGEWNGTREYGETLLAGTKRLEELEKERGYYLKTGYNAGGDIPDDNYYPINRKSRAKYSDGTEIPFDAIPKIFKVNIKGKMSNTQYNPHDDYVANRLMNRYSKSGTAKTGYYYVNDAEDVNSISAVVPSVNHLTIMESEETLTIKTEHINHAYNQDDFSTMAVQNGIVIGEASFSHYNGKIYINYIEIDDSNRRKGIATKIIKEIQKEFPTTEIEFGMMSNDGINLINSLKSSGFLYVNTEKEEKIKQLEKIYKILKETKHELDSMEITSDTISEMYNKISDYSHMAEKESIELDLYSLAGKFREL